MTNEEINPTLQQTDVSCSSISREDINKQAYLVMSNINATKMMTNISDKNHETLMNSFFTLQGMFNEYLNMFNEYLKQNSERFIMEEKKNKPKLTISDYEFEGKIEYTYEIRGHNVYFSKVGFNTYDEAEKEGKEKLTEYVL